MTLADEHERLSALRNLDLLDTDPEEEFDAIVAGARHLFGCRMAFVSLIDAERQWFKARCGFEGTETPRNLAICDHAIATNDMLVVPDTRLDPRFADNPFVTGDPFIRFYAGVPLRISTRRGGTPQPVGTLCVVDDQPQEPAPDKLEMLRGMARVIEALLELRRATQESMRLAMERHEVLVEMGRTQRLLQHAERMARIGSWRVDLENQQTHWSTQTYAIHEIAPGEPVSLDLAIQFFPPGERERVEQAVSLCTERGQPWDMELDFRAASGDMRRIRTLGEPEVRDGRVVALMGVIQDITDRYKHERRLHEVAHTDELTGLASRRAFNQRLDAALTASAADGTPLAVAILDLDRFKEVNDRLGHATGDEVLRLKAAKLRAVTYLGDYYAARLGGDEFVLLLRGRHAGDLLASGITQLLDELRHEVPADDGSISVSTTIGVCRIDVAHMDRSAAMKAADAALYRAKRFRRGTGAIVDEPGIIEARAPAGFFRAL